MNAVAPSHAESNKITAATLKKSSSSSSGKKQHGVASLYRIFILASIITIMVNNKTKISSKKNVVAKKGGNFKHKIQNKALPIGFRFDPGFLFRS
jgi:hypothetical protein